MREYVDRAVVLSSEPSGDKDLRVALFTRRFGKLTPKVKSARKITSKLAGHLQVGNVVRVRLIEKNGLQVADAINERRLKETPTRFYFLNRLLVEAEPDAALWRLLSVGGWNWSQVLSLLGWDPRESRACALCNQRPSEVFIIHTQEFACVSCLTSFQRTQNDVVYIHDVRGRNGA